MSDSYPLSAYISPVKLQEFVHDMLKDGTPAWVSHPEDYRNWLREEEEADHERSCDAAKVHKIDDQEALTDEENSLINFKNVNSFIAELRANGILCKIYQDRPQTCGLYCVRPGYERLGYQFVTSMQVPVMPEWGLLREEDHGVTDGEAAIGWRQVIFQMVLKGIASETQMHRIFGEPQTSPRSNRYRRGMHSIRNGRTKDVRN